MERANFTYIRELSGGDKEFEKKLMKTIKREFPEEKKAYFEYVAQENYEAIAEIVHKIKHKICIFGLENGYEIAIQYENNVRNSDFTLKEKFEESLTELTLFLAS